MFQFNRPNSSRVWLQRLVVLAVFALIAAVCPAGAPADEPMLPGELPLELGRELVGSARLPRLLELEAAVRKDEVTPVALFRLWGDEHNHFAPVWSADGQAFACLRAHVEEKTCKVLVFSSLRDADPQAIYEDTLSYEHMPAWASAGHDQLVFASNRSPDHLENIHLWQRGREARVLTSGLGVKVFPQFDLRVVPGRLLFRRIDMFELLTLSDHDRVGDVAKLGAADEMRFAPRGENLAVVRTTSGSGQELLVRNVLNQSELRLMSGTRLRNPTWSPDGRWLAFWSQPLDAREWELWTVGVTGDPPPARRLARVRVDEDFRHVGPAWSADSLRIWCTSTQGDQSHYPLLWVSPDGSHQGGVNYETTLTTALDVAACPVPGHAAIAFTAVSRRPRDVFVVILNHH